MPGTHLSTWSSPSIMCVPRVPNIHTAYSDTAVPARSRESNSQESWSLSLDDLGPRHYALCTINTTCTAGENVFFGTKIRKLNLRKCAFACGRNTKVSPSLTTGLFLVRGPSVCHHSPQTRLDTSSSMYSWLWCVKHFFNSSTLRVSGMLYWDSRTGIEWILYITRYSRTRINMYY